MRFNLLESTTQTASWAGLNNEKVTKKKQLKKTA